MTRGLNQDELGERAGVRPPEKVGKYERGKIPIPDDDLDSLLNALSYPMEAWLETRNHLEWLEWTGSRHVGSRGHIVDGEDQGWLSWIADADGSLDRDAARRELRRIVQEGVRSRQRHEEDLLELVLALVLLRDRD